MPDSATIPLVHGVARRWPTVMTALMVAIALVACRPPGIERPQWLEAPHVDYPAADYLRGQGAGPSASDARERARADLGAPLYAALTPPPGTADPGQDGFDAPPGTTMRVDAARDAWTRLRRVLGPIPVTEEWREADGPTYHALAVLSRADTARALSNELELLDDRVETQVERARSDTRRWDRAAAAHRAIALQYERQALNAALQTIAPDDDGVPARWQTRDLKALHTEQFRHTTVGVDIKDDAMNILTPAILNALHDIGVTVDDSGDYRLRVHLTHQQAIRGNNRYWQTGTVKLAMTAVDGESELQEQWTIRSAGTDEAATQRAFTRRLNEMLHARLPATLIAFGQQIDEAPE